MVRFYDSYKFDYETLIEMEYIEGNDLRYHINRRFRRNEPFSENFIWTLLAKIASALYHVHNYQIIHRNIKPDIILVSFFGEFKLCDFGLSTIWFENDTQATRCGTPPYYSPEMISGSYSFPTDIWSLGVTIYELMTLKLPFYHKKKKILLNKITKEPTPVINEDYSYELKTLVYSMLEKDPNKRIKLEELLYHEFIVDYYTLADTPTQFSKSIKSDIPHPLRKL
jgi:NIMA (never in mitosis gene a)-related kinase